MKNKCDLNYFYPGMTVGARWATVLQVEMQDLMMRKDRGEWPDEIELTGRLL